MSDFADLRSLQIILCRLAKSAKYLAGRLPGRNFQDERWPRLGGGGLGSRSVSWATGVPAGGCAIRCSPHTPRRFPRGWEGQGSTRVRLRAARRVFRNLRKRLRVPFSTLEAQLSTHLGFSESSTSLGSSQVDRSRRPKKRFGVGGSARRPSRIRRPRRGVPACGVL